MTTTRQALINKPKGSTTYRLGQTFLLHVFWEAPSQRTAQELLDALSKCATATHRDTPCVPVYFFHLSHSNECTATLTINDHPQLQAAIRKLQIGVPRPAVEADLRRRGLDPALLDHAPSAPLPAELQDKPVIIEFTELYLDREAFYDHVGSKDYLAAYESVMQPGLQNRQCTLRLGEPTADLVEKILDPMLKETVIPLSSSCCLFRSPARAVTGATLYSLDLSDQSEENSDYRAAIAGRLTDALGEECISCVSFPHPWRPNILRLMCVSLGLPTRAVLETVAAVQLISGEVFCDDMSTKWVRELTQQVGIEAALVVNASEHVGYWLHDRVAELRPTE